NLRFQIPKTSTGPRSQEGKSRSSQNATKHHLSATNPPPHLLENPTYQISKREFIEEFDPQTPAQCVLVSQLTFTAWKLDQIPHLEHQILSTPLGAPVSRDPKESAALETQPTPTEPKPIDPETYVINRLYNEEITNT